MSSYPKTIVVFILHQGNISLQITNITTNIHNLSKSRDMELNYNECIYKILLHLRKGSGHTVQEAVERFDRSEYRGACCKTMSFSNIKNMKPIKFHQHDCPNKSWTKAISICMQTGQRKVHQTATLYWKHYTIIEYAGVRL